MGSVLLPSFRIRPDGKGDRAQAARMVVSG
jgi:hypothetical protein